ncbi:hypothetical protein [Marinoscillum furvescens]|nr:hypothetical protein [Marinoscillum furvescens]
MEANNELKLIAEKIICHLEVNALMNFEERTVSQRMIGMKKFIHGTYVKPQSAQAALALHYMMSAPKFDQL